MPIIKIKNPNYVDGSGEEKWIDAAIYTNQSNEGVEEAPNNGKDYVRRDSDWVISQKIYDELGITKQRFESLLNNAYIIPTLEAVPDETTLVYVDGEYNVNFKIGDYCRVRNTDSEYGYDFFRLYDIKDGVAVWSAAETEGSGSASGETVLISLISNQSASDNSLLGASIQVYDVTAEETLSETIWQGSEIIVNVPKEHTYTVNVGAVTGYKTPATKTLDAVNGATRILNMQYDCTILTVNLTSNHSADTSKATATINYGSASQTVSSGQSIKIPYDVQVNITCSKILYYKTPTITQFTAGTATKEVSAEYITSMLNVAFTKNQTVSGTPTITVTTDGQTRSYTGNASNIPCAPDSSVTVNFGGLTYYKTPASQTFTKSLNTETKQGDYLSEKVTCILNTDDSKVVTNQVITLTCSSSSSYNKTYTCTSTSTSGDSGFVQYIPYGYTYSITANNFYSYAPLTKQSYTAETSTRPITLQYKVKNITIYCGYDKQGLSNCILKIGGVNQAASTYWNEVIVPCGTTLEASFSLNQASRAIWLYHEGLNTSVSGIGDSDIIVTAGTWSNINETIWNDVTIGYKGDSGSIPTCSLSSDLYAISYGSSTFYVNAQRHQSNKYLNDAWENAFMEKNASGFSSETRYNLDGLLTMNEQYSKVNDWCIENYGKKVLFSLTKNQINTIIRGLLINGPGRYWVENLWTPYASTLYDNRSRKNIQQTFYRTHIKDNINGGYTCYYNKYTTEVQIASFNIKTSGSTYLINYVVRYETYNNFKYVMR